MGCGFITWSLARQPQLLDLALQYEPVAVMLSFGDPAVFADAIKSAGTRLVCQIQNRTQAERALQVGADVLVAQGTEAGGHGHGPRSTLTLVPEIVDLVTARGTDIPVIAAGGIADGRGLAAALMLAPPGYWSVRASTPRSKRYPHRRRGTRCWRPLATTCAAPLSTISYGAIPGRKDTR